MHLWTVDSNRYVCRLRILGSIKSLFLSAHSYENFVIYALALMYTNHVKAIEMFLYKCAKHCLRIQLRESIVCTFKLPLFINRLVELCILSLLDDIQTNHLTIANLSLIERLSIAIDFFRYVQRSKEANWFLFSLLCIRVYCVTEFFP